MRIGWAALVLLFAASVSSAQETGPKNGLDLAPVDTGRVGVGDIAPDFSLRARDGSIITLSGFRGRKTVILVFYRGYW